MKALFVGLGGVGQRHLRNLRRLRPDAELLAVRSRGRSFEIRDDLTPDYGVDIAVKYGIKAFASLDDAARVRPDVAIVSNPTSAHLAAARTLVEAGVPVFLEKPISDSEDGLGELVELSRRRKVPVMIGYMMRFHPLAQRMEELLRTGAVGPVNSAVLICQSHLPSWHRYEKPGEFYAGSRALGGGVVLTEIHELDLLHWYFGAPARLWATGGKLSSLEIDVEDTASALLEFERDGRPFTVAINLSFVQPAPMRQLHVFGEKGRIAWDVLANRIVVEGGSGGVFELPDFQRNELFVRELEHFLDCVKTGAAPKTALESVLDGHRTALKIKAAIDRQEARV